MIGRGPGLNGSSSNGRRRPPAPTRPVPRRTAAWTAVAERAVAVLFGEDDEMVVHVEGEGMEGGMDDQRVALLATIAWFPGASVGGDIVVGAAMGMDGVPVREAMMSRSAVVAWVGARRGVAMAVARQCNPVEDRIVFVGADGGMTAAIMPRRGNA
jgi:hypothetical protein